MFEIILLLGVILLLPNLPGKLLWLALALLVVVPGMYAMYTGAPFVPTPKGTLKRMLDAAKIKKGETVYDLGCGDGRIVRAAAARGARAVGYEFSVPTFVYARLLTLFRRNAEIRYGDFWKRDLRDADVVFCYLLTDTMRTFRQKIWPQLKPGCRVVSHAFKMKEIEPAFAEKSVIVYIKK
jgi:SAM-dependent methyltransferase